MSMVHLGNHCGSRAVRLFKEMAAEFIPTLLRGLSAA
jgi:hypothetical protein